MKRFRVFGLHFDRRVLMLEREEQPHWDERVKAQHRQNREKLMDELIREFGSDFADQKLENFIALGPKPVSIFAFRQCTVPR